MNRRSIINQNFIGLFAVAIFSLICGTVSCLAADPVPQTITLLPQQPRGTISDQLTGVNTIYGATSDAHWKNPALIKAVKNLVGRGMLRYPGGGVTSVWHWQNPIGEQFGKDDTWSPDYHGQAVPASQWMSLDEYFQVIKKTHATALIGINIASGFKYHRQADTAKQTTSLVQHLLSLHRPVHWYYIDNELYARHRMNNKLTAAQYAQAIHRAAKEIRSLQPDAKIVINWQPWTPHWSGGWDTIMKIAGHDFDLVDLHLYWNWGNVTFAQWLKQPHAMKKAQTGRTYVQIIETMRRYLRQHGSHAGVGALEWNIGRYPEKDRPSSFQTALIDSEMMMQFIDAKLDAACFWPLNNGYSDFMRQSLIDHAALVNHNKVQITPVYQALQFFAPLEGQTQLTVQTPGFKTQAVAALNSKSQKITLCILRKDAQPAKIRLYLPPRYFGQITARQIHIQTLHAAGNNTHTNQAQISDEHCKINRQTGLMTLTVPGFSLTKIVLPVRAAPK